MLPDQANTCSAAVASSLKPTMATTEREGEEEDEGEKKEEEAVRAE